MSWETEYASKVQSADEALRRIESNMRVYIQPGCAEPETLVEALIRRAPYVHDVEIVHMLTMGCAPYVAPEMEGHFRHNAMFIGGNVREAINDGRVVMIGPIRQELLSGIKDQAQFDKLKGALQVFRDEPIDTFDYEEVARLYNVCRSQGVECGPVDILICAIAVRRKWKVLASDGGLNKCLEVLESLPGARGKTKT